MTAAIFDKKAHPDNAELADYLDCLLTPERRTELEEHISTCYECLANIVAAHESVASFNKTAKTGIRKKGYMKNINIYLILAIASFALSFVLPRYFLQFLVATIVLGTKWIVDSKTTKMLITIYEAWKTSEKEKTQASRLGQFPKKGL